GVGPRFVGSHRVGARGGQSRHRHDPADAVHSRPPGRDRDPLFEVPPLNPAPGTHENRPDPASRMKRFPGSLLSIAGPCPFTYTSLVSHFAASPWGPLSTTKRRGKKAEDRMATPQAPIGVLVVDDNDLVAGALERWLGKQPDVHWLGWTAD